jgi:hypothetical protein
VATIEKRCALLIDCCGLLLLDGWMERLEADGFDGVCGHQLAAAVSKFGMETKSRKLG